jgi:hypothetical protein
MKVGKRAIHHVRTPVSYSNRKWIYAEEDRHVVVLAISGQWAMVRRPRAMPYVARVSELFDAPPTRDKSSDVGGTAHGE